jgi:3-phenylpropionate/trans-cinnamate dioxygenase ferredoxin reductase subunit
VENFIVVGGGQAASRTADCLRLLGFRGNITLVSEEPHLPYQRPPLCKTYLSGIANVERFNLKHPPFYAQNNIQLKLGARVTAIDPVAHRIQLADNPDRAHNIEMTYDRLILCLGARPRRMNVPGKELAGIHYLRNIEDANAIRADMGPGKRMVIVGAGYIGLELAATARKIGMEVTVVEAADRPISRVVAPVVSDFFADLHATAGVNLLCNTMLKSFGGKSRVHTVETADGKEIPADMVVVAVGVIPVTALAAAAGLDCDNGIVVDEQCRTSDPDIFAAGDCTLHPSVRFGRHVRLESVDNAIEQARVAAEGMCGREARHAHVPWFWSDQYDVKMQIAGLSEGFDEIVVRGDPASKGFSVWYLRHGELLAMNAVNRPLEFMQARKWIAQHHHPDRERLADAGAAVA